MREGLLQAVAHAMLGRPLAQAEAVGLAEALAAADQHATARCASRTSSTQLRDPAERTDQPHWT